MNITINRQEIDYTLENESTLGEVVGEIEKWLGEAGLQIRSIERDGSLLDLSSKTVWNVMSLDDVENVDVVAVTPLEFRAEKLQSLIDYFVAIRDTDEDASEVLASLLEERQAVAELLADAIHGDVARAFYDSSDRSHADLDDDSEELMKLAAEIVPVLEDRLREILEPARNLAAAIPALRESILQLGEVSAYLQNGEDSLAMVRVLQFLELAQKVMRVISSIGEQRIADLTNLHVDGAPITEYQIEISGFLSELSAAITDGDTITIGDLLEYEIGPRFTNLVDALEEGEVLH